MRTCNLAISNTLSTANLLLTVATQHLTVAIHDNDKRKCARSLCNTTYPTLPPLRQPNPSNSLMVVFFYNVHDFDHIESVDSLLRGTVLHLI